MPANGRWDLSGLFKELKAHKCSTLRAEQLGNPGSSPFKDKKDFCLVTVFRSAEGPA
jgi:hypothetical protein